MTYFLICTALLLAAAFLTAAAAYWLLLPAPLDGLDRIA
jgi:hypothetical protein